MFFHNDSLGFTRTKILQERITKTAGDGNEKISEGHVFARNWTSSGIGFIQAMFFVHIHVL